jgi:hypothetical protein
MQSGACVYNWATQSVVVVVVVVGDINTETWFFRLWVGRTADDLLCKKNIIAISKEVQAGCSNLLWESMAQKGLFCQ